MKKFVVVAIDDDSRTLNMYAKLLKGEEYIEKVVKATDGIEGINAIIANEPEIVLLDIVMPNLDGMTMLKLLSSDINLEKKPVVIMITEFSDEDVMREAFANGAKYFFKKPANMEMILNTIRACYEKFSFEAADTDENEFFYERGRRTLKVSDLDEEYIESNVTDIIREVGIPANIKGYHYLKDAIVTSIKSEGAFKPITKILYPEIAKQHDTTPSRVERNIRHAIDMAWDRGSLRSLHDTFGYTVDPCRGRPTNSEFIALVADKLQLKLRDEGKKNDAYSKQKRH